MKKSIAKGPTATPVPTAGATVHNFTTDGTTSSFFNIQGNLSTSKGTVTYQGLTLTLVFNTEGTKVKVDGTKLSYNEWRCHCLSQRVQSLQIVGICLIL